MRPSLQISYNLWGPAARGLRPMTGCSDLKVCKDSKKMMFRKRPPDAQQRGEYRGVMFPRKVRVPRK